MIRVNSANLTYDDVQVLKDVSFEVGKGELLTLVGPSGCGKSTLLRVLTGLERLDSGTVDINNEPLEHVRSKTALLLQDLGLFPWKTVLQNISFILEDRGLSKNDANKKALSYLDSVNMKEYAYRYPNTLSGGQRQRVGFAKAIALEPDLLLLDEATASLDAFASENIQDILKSIHKSSNITMIVVTHKIEEAVYLGDRIALMNQGTIQMIMDNPSSSLDNQRNTFEFFDMCKRVKEEFHYEKDK